MESAGSNIVANPITVNEKNEKETEWSRYKKTTHYLGILEQTKKMYPAFPEYMLEVMIFDDWEKSTNALPGDALAGLVIADDHQASQITASDL